MVYKKKTGRKISIGEIVFTGNDNDKRLSLPLRRVVQLISGQDGKVRLLRLRTLNGSLLRPVQRLFPLECDDNFFGEIPTQNMVDEDDPVTESTNKLNMAEISLFHSVRGSGDEDDDGKVTENLEDLDIELDVEIPLAELLMCTGFLTMYFVEECVHFYLHRRQKARDLTLVRRSLSIRRGELEIKSKSGDEVPELTVKPSHTHNNHADHSHVVIDYSGHPSVVIIRGFLVVLALSVHELFEGLSVGLETSASNVWYMFGAVAAHKLVIAFCIGVELVTSGLKTIFVIIFIFTFAVVSPLGIGVGMIVTNTEETSANFVSVILQGMATGTLMYVVFFEILQGDRKSGLKQFFVCSDWFLNHVWN
ncbi:hypothetical protein NQ317_006695 [Molorchus minor]|uniref:DUF5641 domain-containing protein n=1 Tax=Molorchus minor TaxID=1323400 RepID=A0ABQ9JVB9_9CUCU|nr:hypothetical protein NQ317_006695 [Molorchus minor]